MHLRHIPVSVGQDSIAGFVGIVKEGPYKSPYKNLARRKYCNLVIDAVHLAVRLPSVETTLDHQSFSG